MRVKHLFNLSRIFRVNGLESAVIFLSLFVLQIALITRLPFCNMCLDKFIKIRNVSLLFVVKPFLPHVGVVLQNLVQMGNYDFGFECFNSAIDRRGIEQRNILIVEILKFVVRQKKKLSRNHWKAEMKW